MAQLLPFLFRVFVVGLRSFVRDHFLALKQFFSFDCIECLFVLFKRLLTVWPCFVSLLIGLLLLTLSQVADLLARPLDYIELTVLTLCLLFFWIIPLHLGARILLDAQDDGERTVGTRSKLDSWLPKDLGFLAIIGLVLAIYAQTREFAILGSYFTEKKLHAPNATLWIVPVITFLLYMIYLGIREKTNVTLSAQSGRRLSRLFTLASVVLVFIAIMAPFTLADSLGGLLFLPMLVGGWIMPLVAIMVLSKCGIFWRRIVQFGSVAAIAAMVLANAMPSNPFHDIRLLPEKAVTSTVAAQLPLEDYIQRWMDLNDCAAEQAAGRRCKAILVTAEGGASRAAFQVATVMGQLLDKPPVDGFSDKLFLFSGVSGGSLGLATTRQAMADSVDGKPPCRDDFGRAGRHWIYYGNEKAKEVTTSWRKCLQLLVSADYLTPAVVGLVLRDWWMALPGLLDLGFDDRSALLERAMERHYAAVTGKDCQKMEGLCAPFGHLDLSKRWLPGLILNSTLVERGQTVVASDIDPSSSFPDQATCRTHAQRVYPTHLVYTDAMPVSYDLYELLDARTRRPAEKPDQVPVIPKNIRDLSMSTAIVTSARFPLISSRGNVRDRDGVLVGQLVDGGYFDNSGLANILDIIDALNCHGVDSVVVNIRNNPLDENATRYWRFAGRENVRQPSLERRGQKLSVSLSPVEAFLNSSEGHIIENQLAAISRVGYDNYIFSNVYKAICVGKANDDGACEQGRVQLDSVSMSWWLSSNVQLFLDMQEDDKLQDQTCNEVHCRDRPFKMLTAAFATPSPPDTKTNESLDPKRQSVETVRDLQRFAK